MSEKKSASPQGEGAASPVTASPPSEPGDAALSMTAETFHELMRKKALADMIFKARHPEVWETQKDHDEDQEGDYR